MITAAKRVSQLATHIAIGFLVASTLSGSALLGGLAMLLEPLVNVLLLPLHERAWHACRARSGERHRLALTAAEKISQTLLHMVIAFSIMFGFTGSLASGGIAALVEPICNVLLLPFHDGLWERLRRRLAAAPAGRLARAA
jgi:uncharacterized membrane protein